MKKIVLWSLLSLSIWAETVTFHETKFVEALELYTYRDGTVSYDENKTVVRYKDGKVITKVDNNVTVEDAKGKILTTLNLVEKPDVALYFSLTKALFSKDFKQLEESFEVKKRDEFTYTFIPKGDTKEVMKQIELVLNKDESVKSFTLKFSNGDDIQIEAK